MLGKLCFTKDTLASKRLDNLLLGNEDLQSLLIFIYGLERYQLQFDSCHHEPMDLLFALINRYINELFDRLLYHQIGMTALLIGILSLLPYTMS